MGFHPLLATPFAFLPAYKAGHPAWLRESAKKYEGQIFILDIGG